MLRRLVSRLRDWIAVDDPEDRIEGTGDPITSPQHRRSADARRLLDEAEELDDEQFERSFDEPFDDDYHR